MCFRILGHGNRRRLFNVNMTHSFEGYSGNFNLMHKLRKLQGKEQEEEVEGRLITDQCNGDGMVLSYYDRLAIARDDPLSVGHCRGIILHYGVTNWTGQCQ